MKEDLYSDINELVEKAQKGDKESLFQLYEFYKPLILASTSRCINKDPNLKSYREDITREAIFVLEKLINQYDPNLCYFSYFLSTRIDINLYRHCSDVFENHKSIDEEFFSSNENYDPFNKIDDVIVLEWAISQLNDKQQEAIKLYFFEGLDQEESANKLAISQGSFSKRLQRALSKLRELLGEDFIT